MFQASAPPEYRHSSLHHVKGHYLRREVFGGEGSGPDTVYLDVTWRPGGDSFTVATNCYSERTFHTHKVAARKIRFVGLRAYQVPDKDEPGVAMVAPHSLFVGKAIESGRPVTYVWEADEVPNGFDPTLTIKVYDGDLSRLWSQRFSGHRAAPKSVLWSLTERARASWIPQGQWPKGATGSSRLHREWTDVFEEAGKTKMVSGNWQL